MQDIEKLREEIDQIHGELVRLYRRRLTIAEKIWEIKKQNQMSFIDLSREQKIIQSFDDSIIEEKEKLAVRNFLKNILNETKNYLEAYLK